MVYLVLKNRQNAVVAGAKHQSRRLTPLILDKVKQIKIMTISPQSQAIEQFPPPVEDLQILLDLVLDGLLRELTTVDEEMGQKNPSCKPFTDKVIELAKQFQSEKIEELI